MSKKDIRPQGAEGISHPCNVAKASLTVNDSSTAELLRSVDNEVLVWLEVSIDTLLQLEQLLVAIRKEAEDPRAQHPGAALGRIKRLADLGVYVASDIANSADCSRERFQEIAEPFRTGNGSAR
ncbi:hypothetical protein [Achromobacter insuavis]|uniref:hypothetical protein n=1 Tax=Achromobacter insuavis TaxID=1287735 RepID=UPI001F133CAE|nr:hypothetical protein [Achromobacter insuavis]